MRRVYKNLCPATISASIMAANIWKNSLKNVESDNNKILYETLLEIFYSETVLTFWISLVVFILVDGKWWVRGSAVGCITTLQAGMCWVRFPKVSLKFFIDIILPVTLCPKGLTQPLTGMGTRGKGGRCVGLTTLQHSYSDCVEIWEPQNPGPLRACSGIAL